MTDYTVLASNGQGWKELGEVQATSSLGAVRAYGNRKNTTLSDYQFKAVPTRSWRHTFKPLTKQVTLFNELPAEPVPAGARE